MLKTRVVPLWPAVAVSAVCLAIAGVAGLWHFRAQSEQAGRIARLESGNREARERAEKLARDLEALRHGMASASPAPEREAAPSEKPDVAGKLEESRFVYQLRDKLTAANASIEALQNRVQELQVAAQSAKQENAQLAASEADLREKMNGASRVLEAVQAELKTKGDRLTQAEISNKLLKDENRALSDKVNRLPPLLRDLEELNRRREIYLGNLLRRYKDITEQYRAVSERLEKPDALGSGPELSRINSTISMAEEDLRQLTALNAQAARLRQKMNGN